MGDLNLVPSLKSQSTTYTIKLGLADKIDIQLLLESVNKTQKIEYNFDRLLSDSHERKENKPDIQLNVEKEENKVDIVLNHVSERQKEEELVLKSFYEKKIPMHLSSSYEGHQNSTSIDIYLRTSLYSQYNEVSHNQLNDEKTNFTNVSSTEEADFSLDFIN